MQLLKIGLLFKHSITLLSLNKEMFIEIFLNYLIQTRKLLSVQEIQKKRISLS